MGTRRRAVASADTSGKSILIVEDNPLNMKLFSAMVGAQGYGVLQAGDGLRGLDLAQREHPDLIIMDVDLPGISGLEATRILKADPRTRDIPIIITTAYEYDDEIRASGCDGYMSKPIAVADFVELIDSLMTQVAQPRYVRRMIEENIAAD
jgi:two-component system, cell cycle response regulator DivK